MNLSLIQKQQDSESKLGIKARYEAILERLNDSLSSSPSDIRDVVESVSNKHPKLDEIIKNHPLGKSYSDYTGSTLIGYTPDKASLQLKYWKPDETNPNIPSPVAIKKHIKHKLPENMLVEISYAYDVTNERLVACLPNEFRAGSDGTPVRVLIGDAAQGHHIMGDASFYEKHISGSILSQLFMPIFTTTLNALTFLIKSITPSTDNIKISPNPYVEMVEGYPCTIDLRGNIVRQPIDTKNESSLLPTKNS